MRVMLHFIAGSIVARLLLTLGAAAAPHRLWSSLQTQKCSKLSDLRNSSHAALATSFFRMRR